MQHLFTAITLGLCIGANALAISPTSTVLVDSSFIPPSTSTDRAPAINNSGRVAFIGGTLVQLGGPVSEDVYHVQTGFADMDQYDVFAFEEELSNILNVRIDGAGTAAFYARRDTQNVNIPLAAGIYKKTLGASPRSTVFEANVNDFNATSHPPRPRFDMNESGRVVYSTIVNGTDAGMFPDAGLYRTELNNTTTKLRSGSGTYFNTTSMALDGNGTAYVGFEYTDQGLQRAHLVFTGPSDAIPLSGLSSLIEKTDVGTQPLVDANTLGTAVLSVESNTSSGMFDDGGGGFFSVPIAGGVYIATPTPIDSVPNLQSLDNSQNPADRFFDAAINGQGMVVYHRDLANTAAQLMFIDSTDPVAAPQALLQVGDVINNRTVDRFTFGAAGLNDNNQAAVWIDYTDGFQELRRYDIPEPGVACVLLLGLVLITPRIRRNLDKQ